MSREDAIGWTMLGGSFAPLGIAAIPPVFPWWAWLVYGAITIWSLRMWTVDILPHLRRYKPGQVVWYHDRGERGLARVERQVDDYAVCAHPITYTSYYSALRGAGVTRPLMLTHELRPVYRWERRKVDPIIAKAWLLGK